MSSETITPEQYRLRELYPLYYMYLGALAAIQLSPEGHWHKAYQERLEEIKKEIETNGGTVPAHPGA